MVNYACAFSQSESRKYSFIYCTQKCLKNSKLCILNLYVYITEMSLPNNACYVLFIIESSFPPLMYP